MSGVVANVWRFFVFVVAGAIVLGMLGINLTPLLASATIIGATLGFGAQQIVRDYFSGILMTMEDQYNVGDSVLVGGVTGVIEDVTMRLTRFRSVDGTLYVDPQRRHPPDRQPLTRLGPRHRRPHAARCERRGPRDGPARDHGRGARGGHGSSVRRALHRAPDPRRAANRGLHDDHHARDAAHHPVPARPVDPGPARGDAHRTGQGRTLAGRGRVPRCHDRALAPTP